jgi:hypothetical protein
MTWCCCWLFMPCSKSFGTFLSQQGKQRKKAEADLLLSQAKELLRLSAQTIGAGEAQKAAAVRCCC